MIHHWTVATDDTGAVVSVVVFDYRRVFDLIDHHIILKLDSSWSLVLGFRLSIQLETACEAGVRLPFWEGPSTCWCFPRDQTWTMALPPDDQQSQHPTHVTWKYIDDTTIVEITPCGEVSLAQKCWRTLILKRSLRKQTNMCFILSYSVELIFYLTIWWLFIVCVLGQFLNTVCQFFTMHYLNISRRTLRGFRRGP